ncbi:MAG: proline--tRNA ligase [Planctomyces sp.]|nr:proline--tRNA ligase [Planctomyces sp.]MBA4120101.1 proline--tRNA ligase [Isosphaera sp.]
MVSRWTRTLIPTLREAPAEAESPSHVLLLRAGYIRKLGAGIYDYLPLGYRVLSKVAQIVRQEMNAAGAAELSLPVLLPIELYSGTRRDADYGDLLFKVTDRKGAVAALGPTHEEPITEALKGCVSSYKQLPLNVYQIQTKFRDEARPRSGLLRGREFLMKDAYSFHTSVDGPGGLSETYDRMYAAYVSVFRRCGLRFTAVEAESGPIGGSASHEFMVDAESGEDTVLKCAASGYAANVEKCEIGARQRGSLGLAAGAQPLAEVHTPAMPGIEAVAAHLKTAPQRMLKTIVFAVLGRAGEPAPAHRWVAATVRGDHEVNEGKVRSLSGYAVALADERAARAAGFAIGYVSPRVVGAVPGTLVLIDEDASADGPWVSGADKADHHVTGFDWRREIGGALDDPGRVRVGDVRNAMAGDPSPRAAGSRLETGRGIEVGHIFKLGTKYSEAMGFRVLDEKQQQRPVIMGCYGIGVSRTMAACVEMSHDAAGIVWPMPLAPYHVLIVPMKAEDPQQAALAQRLSAELASGGVDVLIDDRDERPGVKFKDADLIGVPVRLTLGDKALAAGSVEFKLRTDAGKGELVPIAQAAERTLAAVTAGLGGAPA